MKVSTVLGELNLGKSVAEFDEGLDRYFVDTEIFRSLTTDTVDIIAGDKGTGKTALYRTLKQRYAKIPELAHTEIITGFNVTGNPVFQKLVHIQTLTEGQYRAIWKTYIFSLVANWLLQLYDENTTEEMDELQDMLTVAGLRSYDDSAETVFSRIVGAVSRLLRPSSAEVEVSLSETGMPIVKPKLEFEKDEKKTSPVIDPNEIPYEAALKTLDKALGTANITVWIAFDRLDEAFQGFENIEIPALRALLRSYLDIQDFPHIKLKLFVRKDLFRKVISGGFVNLTHINAQKIEIVWDEEDLLALLAARVRESTQFSEALSLTGSETDIEVFYKIFPGQIDPGSRKPNTWNWMMTRIRDGNNIKPPRNLLDLVEKARQTQLRDEQRSARDVTPGEPLIQADSVRKAQKQLSQQRVEDTLLAESPELAETIELFRGGRAEHNAQSLSEMLLVPVADIRSTVRPLQHAGFLEEIGSNFKVPSLYREGLEIKQGKAFAMTGAEDQSGDEADNAESD
ncbi:P-loop ATPase, Sll1717 family [Edaphobacter sp. DSM 109919]|uniref:ATP-binding protein n=1 Tax=Edaphobacter paludis TaxID=3035702 RepID=A0AAU7CYP1_9BACT